MHHIYMSKPLEQTKYSAQFAVISLGLVRGQLALFPRMWRIDVLIDVKLAILVIELKVDGAVPA